MPIEIREVVIRATLNPAVQKIGQKVKDYMSGSEDDGTEKDEKKGCGEEAKKVAKQEVINQFSEMLRNEKER